MRQTTSPLGNFACVAPVLFGLLLAGISEAAEPLLGSPEFQPSPEHPVGWRGDGSGSFPGATPPLKWSLSKDGAATNIVWQSEMPFHGTSSVIAVRDRLFTTCNDYDLVSVDKKTGKVLWVRPVSPYDAATKEDREAHKDAFLQLDTLAKKRDELTAKISSAAPTEVGKFGEALNKVEKEMEKILTGTDKEKYKSTGMSYSDGGYMATTPASDGELVFAWNAWGVTACFDLNGERKWIRFDKLRPQEHGHYGSPLLVDDKVIIYIGWRYMALDKKTGKEVWTSEYHRSPEDWYGFWYGSHVATRIGAEKVIVAGDGSLIRAKDGQRFVKGNAMQGTSPIVCKDRIFWISRESPYSYVLPSSTEGKVAPAIEKYTFDFKASAFMSTSPLYHDHLIYILGSNPLLFVYELAPNKLVYSKELNFGETPKRSDRPYGCGLCASPSFAGGKIFLPGNFGTTLVIEPGREYKEIARNTIERHFPYNYKDDMLEGTVSNPFFEGDRIYYRAQRYLYCIGATGK